MRHKSKFLQKFLIPNSLTAGFILLIFYNIFSQSDYLSTENLGTFVYHFLSISFIAMTLKKSPPRKDGKGPLLFSNSISIIFQYAIQSIVGLLATLLFIKTLYPNLFPGFGFFVPLGFALGPGQAYAIGSGWQSFGFQDGGNVGLCFAAIGFIYACFGGIWFIHYGIRKKWIRPETLKKIHSQGVKTGFIGRNKSQPSGAKLTTDSEAIDSFSFNIAFIFATYFISYLFLKWITWLLSFLGQPGVDLGSNLWGINFVFSALFALLVKGILKYFKKDHLLDNGTLSRLSGFSIDFMVTAAVGAISLVVVAKYWLPIIVIGILGGIVVFSTVPWFCSRLFKDHRFDRTLLMIGVNTGTMPTGLALLRVIDPEFETPVASDYMFSTGITFSLVIPFILAINLPAYTYTSGNPLYFWLAIAVALAYLIFALVSFVLIARRRAFRNPSQTWYRKNEEKYGMQEN